MSWESTWKSTCCCFVFFILFYVCLFLFFLMIMPKKKDLDTSQPAVCDIIITNYNMLKQSTTFYKQSSRSN